MQLTAIDPLKTRILFENNLPDKITVLNEDHEKARNCFNETLTRPAMIISTDNESVRYYFRAISWDKTLLLKAVKVNGDWIVTELTEDSRSMSDIISRGKLIYECM